MHIPQITGGVQRDGVAYQVQAKDAQARQDKCFVMKSAGREDGPLSVVAFLGHNDADDARSRKDRPDQFAGCGQIVHKKALNANHGH